jgi:hypothetical protein
MNGWVSPRLGIRFDLSSGDLEIIRPDGRRFLSYLDLAAQREQERKAREQAEQQVEQERKAREQAQQRAERLAARLRELGEDPDA